MRGADYRSVYGIPIEDSVVALKTRRVLRVAMAMAVRCSRAVFALSLPLQCPRCRPLCRVLRPRM